MTWEQAARTASDSPEGAVSSVPTSHCHRLPLLQLNQGKPGPSLTPAVAVGVLGKCPHCRVAPGEQRGPWEQNRKIWVTQRFLAWGAAAASRAQRERGGQAGRDPLEESGQRTVGSGMGMRGLEMLIKSDVWGLTGGRSGGSHALPGARFPSLPWQTLGPISALVISSSSSSSSDSSWPAARASSSNRDVDVLAVTALSQAQKTPPCSWTPASGEAPPARSCSAWGTVPWAAHEPMATQPCSRGSWRAAAHPHCSHTGSARLLACHSAASLCFFPSCNCFDLHSRGSLLKINVSWMLLPIA